MPQTRWSPSPDRPALAPDAVDVWYADLAAAVAHGGAHELLSDDERERAARFVDPAAGRRWAAARGILRTLLGRCADADPRALRFAAGAHGKPSLADVPAVRFNLSHAGDVALYAVALEREVGVDVELPRRSVDAVAIARRVLGDAEARRLGALDPDAQQREFLRAWVRWEALIKCSGTGIGGADDPPVGPDPWIRALSLAEPAGAAAALAVAGGRCEVRCWRWADG